jgi:hypothetical protein
VSALGVSPISSTDNLLVKLLSWMKVCNFGIRCSPKSESSSVKIGFGTLSGGAPGGTSGGAGRVTKGASEGAPWGVSGALCSPVSASKSQGWDNGEGGFGSHCTVFYGSMLASPRLSALTQALTSIRPPYVMDAEDGRVGVETWKDGVADLRHGVPSSQRLEAA